MVRRGGKTQNPNWAKGKTPSLIVQFKNMAKRREEGERETTWGGAGGKRTGQGQGQEVEGVVPFQGRNPAGCTKLKEEVVVEGEGEKEKVKEEEEEEQEG